MKRAAGCTLPEIMSILVALVICSAGVSLYLFNRLEDARRQFALLQLQKTHATVLEHQKKFGSPKRINTMDPWGQLITIEHHGPTDFPAYIIRSLGPDQLPNTKDDLELIDIRFPAVVIGGRLGI